MIVLELILVGANEKGIVYILSEDEEKIVIPSSKNRPIDANELCKQYTDIDTEWINPIPIYFHEDSDGIIHLVSGNFVPIDIILTNGKFIKLHDLKTESQVPEYINFAITNLSNMGTLL
tara:strand:- start:1 stop:357 length:357 start_codon:yes stop_codon:yes gene_type:complete